MQYTLYSLLRKHGEVMSEKHSKNHFLVTNKTETAMFSTFIKREVFMHLH